MSSAFDIIFAGGGTTACVVAGRLAAADPSLKILIIESGQHTRDVPSHVQPCRYAEHLFPTSTTVSFHVGKPSAHLNGRAPIVPCGRSVGGGSAVNFMVYVRGAASDYNDWAAFGNEGWSFDELLPLIRKLETFTPISDRSTHGYSGPIHISAKGTDFGIGKQFLEVGKAYDPGRPQVDDANDFETSNAYGPFYRYVDPATGKRCDAASRYLYPHLKKSNLEIMTGKRVKRVIIENGRAVGVEYTSDAISNPGASKELFIAKATKLVVVSGGAFGSPAILERSGIGSPSILAKNNVNVLVDLPGVGENYQDHNGVLPAFHSSDDTEIMDVWKDSDPEAMTTHLKEWEVNGTGQISHNGIEAMAKIRPTAAELLTAGPALRQRWETFFENSPDKPMAMIVPFSGNFLRLPSVGRKLICVIYYLMYPESVGSVHIASGEDANAPLDFDPNYFSTPSDIAQHTLLYKMTRELFRRMPAYRGEVAAYHPQFPIGSPAACRETDNPVPIDAPDIVYSEADNEAIVNFNRDRLTTTWHSVGTCAMKPRDQGGVVNACLNVYGVEGLKVADLSICPTNVGNNTYSTALLVGEKAATIIAEDLGGTTACVIAGRLIAADPALKILIIESGQHSRDAPCHVQPCRYVENLAAGSTTVSFHIGKSSTYLNGRAPVVSCGRTLGGGSAVNFMMYVRGSASDYDDWAALGNEGWGFEEVLPLIKKIETFAPISDRPTHGYSGPVGISARGAEFGVGKQFLEVGKAYDPDRPQVDDTNDFKTANAYGPAYRYVDPVTGRRCDAASRYIYPHSGNPNLVIMVGKRVKRVIIENGRAVGVEYTSDVISSPGTSREPMTAKAAKLVVISGGAFGSPSILERSGIGSPRILAKNNIDVFVDLPGVGENYKDHYNIRPVFHLSEESETMDDIWSDSGVITEFVKEWEASGKGKVAYNGIEAMLKMRPTAAELASAGPVLQMRWETFFQHRPDKPMAMIVPFSGFRLHHSLVGRKFISVSNYILYPEAIGHVHITSGEDANAPLDFDPKICSKLGDIAQLTLLYKMTRERVRRMPAYRGEVAIYNPQFPAGSPAACKEADVPVSTTAPDVVYSDKDDEAIVDFVRNTAATSWHSLGTCAMKPRDQGGVVDARLNVYGVEGLKVADLSICPTNVGNNTYSTALLIGEKAAAIIGEDLGMKSNDE